MKFAPIGFFASRRPPLMLKMPLFVPEVMLPCTRFTASEPPLRFTTAFDGALADPSKNVAIVRPLPDTTVALFVMVKMAVTPSSLPTQRLFAVTVALSWAMAVPTIPKPTSVTLKSLLTCNVPVSLITTEAIAPAPAPTENQPLLTTILPEFAIVIAPVVVFIARRQRFCDDNLEVPLMLGGARGPGRAAGGGAPRAAGGGAPL